MKKSEKEVNRKLDEIGAKEKATKREMENWFEERRVEMKGWREEQVRSIWKGKQNVGKERGWFRFDGGRKEAKVEGKVEKLDGGEKS